LHHLVQQLVHWLFGFQNLLDHTVGYIEYKLDQPPLVVGSLVQLVQPWRCSTMWVQPTNWYFTQWCFEPMAGTHHVNHAMPNTKSNPHEMPYVASNTHGNVMPKKAGFKLYFSQQANTAAQWSMIVWLPSCMASWILKTPGCSGAEQKWFQLLFGQWDHNITQGWFLALHQTLDAGAIQWHFHNF
jgi:hypothetical protein